MRVLPDVLAGKDCEAPEGLLDASVEFIAPAGTERRRRVVSAAEQRVQHRRSAADAGEHQIFVKGGLECAGVGNPQNGVGGLDVVGRAEARLRFPVRGEAVVEVAAQTEIERPASFGDRVLKVDAELFDIGMTAKALPD